MKGRIYDPLAGRFMTADPVTQAPFWSQGLNRYSYVFNNPINNTDPSGFSATDWDGGIVGGIVGAGHATGAGLIYAGFGGTLGGLASGLGIGALNPVTSLLSGTYGQFDGSAGGSQSVKPPTTAPKGGMGGINSPPGASNDNKGDVGLTYHAQERLPGTSLFDRQRGALAQNFQRGGYCHEDGPCHDYTPVMPLGLVGDVLAEIANTMDSISKWWHEVGSTKGAPKPTPKFEPPTNPPQMPPKQIPEGWRVREMPATEQYPNGYWKLEKPMNDGSWQPIDPSTMKPGTRPQTHVPFPPKP